MKKNKNFIKKVLTTTVYYDRIRLLCGSGSVVERHLAKVNVASSNLVFRSKKETTIFILKVVVSFLYSYLFAILSSLFSKNCRFQIKESGEEKLLDIPFLIQIIRLIGICHLCREVKQRLFYFCFQVF